MAAITPSNTTQRASRADLVGTGFHVFRFASVGTGDTWSSGKHGVIACAVSDGGTKSMRVVFDDSAGLGDFDFSVTTGPATDVDLYVWGPDY